MDLESQSYTNVVPS